MNEIKVILLALLLMCVFVPTVDARYEMVNFSDEETFFIDPDRLQYGVDEQNSETYYDIWAKMVYKEAGKAQTIEWAKKRASTRKTGTT